MLEKLLLHHACCMYALMQTCWFSEPWVRGWMFWFCDRRPLPSFKKRICSCTRAPAWRPCSPTTHHLPKLSGTATSTSLGWGELSSLYLSGNRFVKLQVWFRGSAMITYWLHNTIMCVCVCVLAGRLNSHSRIIAWSRWSSWRAWGFLSCLWMRLLAPASRRYLSHFASWSFCPVGKSFFKNATEREKLITHKMWMGDDQIWRPYMLSGAERSVPCETSGGNKADTRGGGGDGPSCCPAHLTSVSGQDCSHSRSCQVWNGPHQAWARGELQSWWNFLKSLRSCSNTLHLLCHSWRAASWKPHPTQRVGK